jgi:hypothetical protein
LEETPKDLFSWAGLRLMWIKLRLLELRGFVDGLAGVLVWLLAGFDGNKKRKYLSKS